MRCLFALSALRRCRISSFSAGVGDDDDDDDDLVNDDVVIVDDVCAVLDSLPQLVGPVIPGIKYGEHLPC